MKKKFPKTIYVYLEEDGGGDGWWSAEESAENCAKKDEKVVVGVYELKEKIKISFEVKKEFVIEKEQS